MVTFHVFMEGCPLLYSGNVRALYAFCHVFKFFVFKITLRVVLPGVLYCHYRSKES